MQQTAVQNNEDFPVTTTIRNTSDAEEMLVVWTCSYPSQWRPDNSIVKTQVIDCAKNVPTRVGLKPGETYASRMYVRVELKSPEQRQPEQRQSVTFRLGYGTDAYFGTIEPAPTSPAIWSNAVTVDVVSK